MILYKYTEGIGSDGNAWCESCSWYQLAWQIFIGSALSLQANDAVILQTGRDHFLPRPFQFIMHQPVIVSWWILILTQLNGYSLLILCTVYCDVGRLGSGQFWLQAVQYKCVPCTNEKCILCWMVKLCCRDVTPSTLTQNYTGTADSPLWQRQIKTWHNCTCCFNMWQQTMRLPTYCKNGSDMSFVGQEPAQNGQAGCGALEE